MAKLLSLTTQDNLNSTYLSNTISPCTRALTSHNTLCPCLPQNSYSQHLLRTDPSTRFLFSASPTPRYPSRCVVQFNSASAMKTSITSPSQSVISTSYKLTELLYCSSAVPCLLTVIVAMDITSTVHAYLSLQLGMPCLLHCGISVSSTEDIYSPSLLPRVPA